MAARAVLPGRGSGTGGPGVGRGVSCRRGAASSPDGGGVRPGAAAVWAHRAVQAGSASRASLADRWILAVTAVVPEGRVTAVTATGARLAARPAIDKRLRPLYATGFIQGFVLWYSIEKLFMRSIHLNDYLITIVTIVYIAVMMMANIPLGMLADRWSRKGVLYLATLALIGSSVVCGFSHGLVMYAAGISAWGLFYAAYAGTYDSIIYDVVLEETGSADGFQRYYGRVQMFDSVAFIVSALLSAGVARYASLRLEYLLTVPLTCCAFLTLSRFREPSLHRQVPKAYLTAHLGHIVRAATRSKVAWIVVALVANGVALRLMIEFCQLWYLGLALPVVVYGPACALLHSGVWGGSALAPKLRSKGTVLLAAFATLVVAGGLFVRIPAAVIGAQVALIMGITVLNIALTRHLHEAMPSNIRAGASSVVSTIGYGVFVPTALGLGLVSRAHGIFQASVFVVAPLAVMFLSVARMRRWARRPVPRPVLLQLRDPRLAPPLPDYLFGQPGPRLSAHSRQNGYGSLQNGNGSRLRVREPG